MQTLCAFLLLAGAASTIAFTPHGGRFGRSATGASSGSGAGAGATAGAFATSGAYANGQGAMGGGGFAFPGPASYGPASFESAFRSYFDHMEAMLAAQQAHAQALSNRFWAEWQNSIPHQAEAAQQSSNSVSGGYSPQYFQYGIPQASHSHSAVNFYPHRFNPANANAIGNNVDAGQGSYGASYGVPSSSTNYASVSSSDNAGGDGYGASYGGGYGGSFAGGAGGAGGAEYPAAGSANAGAPGQSGYSAGGGHAGSGLGGNAQGAQASLSVNDRGGFGQAQLFPDPELSSRIAGDIAPLSGGSYGVFSSSSSSSHSDPSGKTHTFKQATVGVNDNGKVTTFSVKDP